MPPDPYATLYGRLNWDAPTGRLRCTACMNLGAPKAGAYPSALAHYEEILGPLSRPRTRARVLVVLQDPRAGETNFTTADPSTSGMDLGATSHRYFCLSPVAWRALKLDLATGSQVPRWPSDETAPHFLRRYLARRGPWSYDGFLAYFLNLLRPEDALVTDLAKCHFGEKQEASVYERCASLHLRTEIAELQPNMVLSFTSLLRDGFLSRTAPEILPLVRLNLFHPASWANADARCERFSQELASNGDGLLRLGIDAEALSMTWNRHVAAARRGSAG